MSFTDAINLGIEKVMRAVDKKCYSITFDWFTAVVRNTPVLKGHLINSWYPQVGRGFSNEVETSYSKTGSASLSRINALANSGTFYKKNGAMTMTNNLDYSRRAEYDGWPTPQWSGKVGPYAMVRLSLLNVAMKGFK